VLVAEEVDDLEQAVASAPALVAGAVERWRAQPRNPNWRPARATPAAARAGGTAAVGRRRDGRPPDAPAAGLWPAGAETRPAGAAGPQATPLPSQEAMQETAGGGTPPSGVPPAPPSAPVPREPARFGRVATTAQLPLFGE
jgi:hypothetical protein